MDVGVRAERFIVGIWTSALPLHWHHSIYIPLASILAFLEGGGIEEDALVGAEGRFEEGELEVAWRLI